MINNKEDFYKRYDLKPVRVLLSSKFNCPDSYTSKFVEHIVFLQSNKVNTTHLIQHLIKRAKTKDINHVLHDFSIAKFVYIYKKIYANSKILINQTREGPDTQINGLECEIKSRTGLSENDLPNEYIQYEFGEIFEKELENIFGIKLNGKVTKPRSPIFRGVKQNSDVIIVDISSTGLGGFIKKQSFKSVLPKISKKQTVYIFFQDLEYSEHFYGLDLQIEDVLWDKLKKIQKEGSSKSVIF